LRTDTVLHANVPVDPLGRELREGWRRPRERVASGFLVGDELVAERPLECLGGALSLDRRAFADASAPWLSELASSSHRDRCEQHGARARADRAQGPGSLRGVAQLILTPGQRVSTWMG
jgi:hypothetical protein